MLHVFPAETIKIRTAETCISGRHSRICTRLHNCSSDTALHRVPHQIRRTSAHTAAGGPCTAPRPQPALLVQHLDGNTAPIGRTGGSSTVHPHAPRNDRIRSQLQPSCGHTRIMQCSVGDKAWGTRGCSIKAPGSGECRRDSMLEVCGCKLQGQKRQVAAEHPHTSLELNTAHASHRRHSTYI